MNKQYVTNDSTGKECGAMSGHRGIAPGFPGTVNGGAGAGCVSAGPAERSRRVPTVDTSGIELLLTADLRNGVVTHLRHQKGLRAKA